jgi:eukaryotic-like serine/threonine-protein kinase
MPPKPLEPGDPERLGRFELLGRLGEGGQGVVYLGRGAGPGEERVAVKVLRSTVDPVVLERLGRELEAVHQVQPFVTARIIEASSDGDRRFVVSEFIDGPSLQERVDAQGPLPEGDLLRLAVGTATALTAIHGAGVVHRDFKPANVLLGPDGPRVVDFGIARVTDAATITSGLIGTPAYVAPEQLAGVRPTSAVDIFAWAVTMMFAATGRLAFGADAIPAVMHRIMYEEPDVSDLPPSLQPVILQCLDKDPARRPTARELLLRLVDPSAQHAPAAQFDPRTSWTGQAARTVGPADPALWTDPVPAMPGSTISGRAVTPRTTRSRRGPVLAAAGGAAVLALIVVGILLLTRGSPPGHATGTGSTPPVAHSGTATPVTAQAAGPIIPAQFAGTWTGTATISAIGNSSLGIQNPITFTFAAGSRTAHETDQDPTSGSTCVNTLTLTKATATVLTFSEPAVPGQCVAGTVTFTKHGANLDYRWLDAAGLEQNTATLHKKKKT